MLPVLSVSNLTKAYGKKKVVNNVTFSIFAGQIFGFVGPNGAGKSTTIRMITGLTPITSGEVSICGYSIKTAYKKAISHVGGIIEMPQLYPYLSGMKNLKLFASFYGKAAIARIKPPNSSLFLRDRHIDNKEKNIKGISLRVEVPVP